jgi:hypothetical protein
VCLVPYLRTYPEREGSEGERLGGSNKAEGRNA